MGKLVFGLVAAVLGVSMNFAFAGGGALGGDILENGDFKKVDQNGFPSGWQRNYVGPKGQFKAELSGDAPQGGGSGSLKLDISAAANPEPIGYGHCYSGDIAIKSAADPLRGLFLNVSCWMKMRDVALLNTSGWQGAYLAVDFYDGARKVLSANLFSSSGSQEWSKVCKRILVPRNAGRLRVVFGMAHCTGSALINDLKVSYEDSGAMSSFDENVKPPYLIPTPWKVSCDGRLLKFGAMDILFASKDVHPSNLAELEEVLTTLSGVKPSVSFASGDEPAGKPCLLAGRRCDYIESHMRRRGLEADWKELGDEGYFLSCDDNGILIAANTDKGIFYGIQTLRQLIVNDGKPRIYQATISDRPLFKIRGLYTGPWWGPFSKSKVNLVERMNRYKMNFIHIGGIGAGKIQDGFRKPFTNREKEDLRALVAYCKGRFITLEPFIAPAHKDAIVFSSEEDVKRLLDKIDALCEVGFENFSLSFDDLENIKHNCLYNDADRKAFRNYGQAHASLVRRVYDHLKAKGSGYSLRCTPTAYYHGGQAYWNPERLEYMDEMKTLPKDIPFIVCQSAFKDKDSFDTYLAIANRQPLLMGTWARFERLEKLPMIIPGFGSYEDQPTFQDEYRFSPGMLYLMLAPGQEDCGLVSFATSADFAWNPVAYDARKSAQRQILGVLGSKEGCEKADKLNALCFKSINCPLPDGGTRQDRLDCIDGVMKELSLGLDGLKGTKAYDMLKPTVDSIMKKYEALLNYETVRKDYPLFVGRCDKAPVIDGSLDDACWKDAKSIGGLLQLGKALKAASPNTEVKLAYDSANIYVAFVCEEPDMKSLKAEARKRNDPVFMDDCVEIFLDVQRNQKVFHVALNTNNVIWDVKSDDGLWHGKYETAISKLDGRWQAEIAIPVSNFGMAGIKPGDRWNVNFCRERHVPPKVNSTWSYLPFGGGFGQPFRFDTVEFK